jgi:hypothetical protein
MLRSSRRAPEAYPARAATVARLREVNVALGAVLDSDDNYGVGAHPPSEDTLSPAVAAFSSQPILSLPALSRAAVSRDY